MDSADSGSLDDSATTVDLGHVRKGDPTSSAEFVFIDNYRIDEELGRGGMGEVYLATEQGLNRQVALKVLQAANRISSTQVKRFLLEAQAAAQLSHDHIVPIYHVGESQGIHYFTMRYIEGHDLSEIILNGQRALRDMSHGSAETLVGSEIKSKSKTGKPADSTAKGHADSTNGLIDLSANSFVVSQRSSGSRSAHKLAVSVALIGQLVAEALQHAHEHGIVHRDIKPSNLMLDHTNKIWVTDFGLAQLQAVSGLTNTGDILGTLRYMSPEQATGQRAFIDHRTDIYSLGVTLYELSTLQKACRGDSAQEILRSITFERPQPIRKINPKLPRDLETIIGKATERNPSDRYQTAAEMAADLERFANSQSLMARRPSRLKAVRNWVWDRPVISAMALAMLIVFAGSMIVVAMAINEGRTLEQQRADESERMLGLREGQQLISKSLLQNRDQPSLAIAAAVEGAKAAPGATADLALMAAIDLNHELRTIPLQFDFPGQCEVSSDGKYVMVCTDKAHWADAKQNALVIDLSTGKQAGVLKSNGVVTGGTYFDADKFILSSSFVSHKSNEVAKSTVLEVWDARTFSLLSSQQVSDETSVTAANYSGVRRQLVIPNSESSATVLNVPDFEPLMVLPSKHEQPVIRCIFSQDGNLIATWSLDCQLIIWDASTGTELRRIVNQCKQPSAVAIFFTADSKQICISSRDGSRFISCRDEKAAEFKQSETVVSMSSKNNLAYLLSGSRKSVIVQNTVTHHVLTECKADTYISGVTPLLDDQFISTIQDESLLVYDVGTGGKRGSLKGHTDYVQAVVAIPGKSEVVSVAGDGTLRHWDIRSDLQRRTLGTQIVLPGLPIASQSQTGRLALLGTIRVSESYLKRDGFAGISKLNLRGEVVTSLSRGRVLTSTTNDVAIWDLTTQKRDQVAAMPPGNPAAIKLAIEIPESDWIALLTHESELFFWDCKSGIATPFRLKEGERATGVVLNHTGSLLLAVSTGEIVLLETGSWDRKSITQLPFAAYDLKLHPVKELLLFVGESGVAGVCNLQNAEPIRTFTRPDSPIAFAEFAGSDSFFTHSGLGSKELTLWNLTEGVEFQSVPIQSIVKVDTNSTKDAIAVAAQSGALYWDLKSNDKIIVTTESCKSVAFVGEKLVVVTGQLARPEASGKLTTESSKLLTWDWRSKTLESSVEQDRRISRITPLGDKNSFIASTYSFGIDCIDLTTGKSVYQLTGHNSPLILAAFSSTENEIVSVSSDGSVLLHSLDNGHSTPIGRPEYPISAAAISNDRNLLLTADLAAGIRYWDLQTQKLVRELNVGGEYVSKLSIAFSNTCALAQTGKNTIKQWDLRTGTEKNFTFEEGIQKAVLSPDGQSLLVATGNKPVYPAHPSETRTIIGDRKLPQLVLVRASSSDRKVIQLDGLVSDFEFVDGGKKIATLSTRGLIQIFEVTNLNLLVTIEAPRRTMQLLEGPMDSKTVYAASKNYVSGWNIANGQLVNQFSLSLTGYQAAAHPTPVLPEAGNPFYLLMSERRFVRQPVNVLDYAKLIAPRQLNEKERLQLLLSP